MASFRQGDFIRVRFPYTDRPARQHRPALVVSHGGIGEGNSLLWVVMITSAENRPWPDDLSIERNLEAGLPAPSVIRPCKIATIEARHAEAIGCIAAPLLRKVKIRLRAYLDLQ